VGAHARTECLKTAVARPRTRDTISSPGLELKITLK